MTQSKKTTQTKERPMTEPHPDGARVKLLVRVGSDHTNDGHPVSEGTLLTVRSYISAKTSSHGEAFYWAEDDRNRSVNFTHEQVELVRIDSPYTQELIGRRDDLKRALFVLARVDGVAQETHDGVAAALATVEAQIAEQREAAKQ
jgi:hypothetical protein